jgi:hypothetical protein
MTALALAAKMVFHFYLEELKVPDKLAGIFVSSTRWKKV